MLKATDTKIYFLYPLLNSHQELSTLSNMFDIQHWALDNRSTWDLDFTIPRLNEIYNGCNSLDQSNDKIQEILHEERYTRFDRLVGIKTTEGIINTFYFGKRVEMNTSPYSL